MKHLSAEGKKSLNLLIEELGKTKGRNLFYSLEKNKPEWTKNWRGKENGRDMVCKMQEKS